jgi:hypothetical protein
VRGSRPRQHGDKDSLSEPPDDGLEAAISGPPIAKEIQMKTLLITAALLAATPAFATETCPDTPKDKWLRAEDIQQRMEKKGYEVRRVKKEGTCFEVKATKDGKRVEAYVNPADATIVKETVKS